jgi:hypothetical protein
MKPTTLQSEQTQERAGKRYRHREHAARVSCNERANAFLLVTERSELLKRRGACVLNDNGFAFCRTNGFIGQNKHFGVTYLVPASFVSTVTRLSTDASFK